MRTCFQELVPRTKWKSSERNVQVGDVGLIKYSSKHAAPAFRLCRVAAVFPDEEGHVRTCEVKLRPRRQGESGAPSYKYRAPNVLKVGVQRIAIILPVEEQSGDVQQAAADDDVRQTTEDDVRRTTDNDVQKPTDDSGVRHNGAAPQEIPRKSLSRACKGRPVNRL